MINEPLMTAALPGNRDMWETFGAGRLKLPSAVCFLQNEATHSGGAASNCEGRLCLTGHSLLSY